MHRTIRLRALPWRKLCRSLLLPFLLLLAQQGALLHELSHNDAPSTQDQNKKQSAHGEACELCLGFAQLDNAAAPNVVVLPLRADLLFHPAPMSAPYVGGTLLPSLRNRGPPPLL
ncbi:MAG: hypothetical protein JF606_17215 [Burkholderiales bacterium]|nr:hypothetical protein [Burkholderiales bacterium]